MMEDYQGEGEKEEETEIIDVADKNTGEKSDKGKKRYKFRAGRRSQSREWQAIRKERA